MQRIIASALLAVFSGALAACTSTNSGVWDEIDARSAAMQPGGAANVPAAGPPLDAQPQVARPVQASMPLPALEPLLPRNAAPAPGIAGLEFLTGRWTAINPNKTVNEEVWTPPRGNSLLGSFRQIQPDGTCSFVELSQIAVNGEEITLRLRHLSGRLDVSEDSAEVSVYRLVSFTKDRIEFAGITGAESVTSLVYERTSETELKQSVGFSAESGEKGFVTNYVLNR